MAITVSQLLGMSRDQLDDLFRASPSGPIPSGEAAGTAIVTPGSPMADVASRIVQALAWQGKVFDPEAGTLRNRVTPVGIAQITARVYAEDSWFDSKPCIVLDYSDTSFVAQSVRDEIREVSPNLYLGIVYIGKQKTINFALEFDRETPKRGLVGTIVDRLRSLFGRRGR